MSDTEEQAATLMITIYGGKKDEVVESVEKHLVLTEDATLYQTWVNISAMKRLAFLFEGGVESAGGVFEILCMFAVLAAVIALFAAWQLIVFFLVLIVLGLLSGGAAFKFAKGTYIEADASKIAFEKLATFVKYQVVKGRFVLIRTVGFDDKLDSDVKNINDATRMFRIGIQISLIVATAILVFEIIYRLFENQWLWDLNIFIVFGFAFLVGVIVMDVGVVLRHRIAKRLSVSSY